MKERKEPKRGKNTHERGRGRNTGGVAACKAECSVSAPSSPRFKSFASSREEPTLCNRIFFGGAWLRYRHLVSPERLSSTTVVTTWCDFVGFGTGAGTCANVSRFLRKPHLIVYGVLHRYELSVSPILRFPCVLLVTCESGALGLWSVLRCSFLTVMTGYLTKRQDYFL